MSAPSMSAAAPAAPATGGLTASVLDALSNGVTFGDLKGVKERDYEVMYAVAHSYYAQARYNDAFALFGWLLFMKPYERRFMLACASCQQMLKRYDKAVPLYLNAALLDQGDPKPLFHMAECLIADGHVEEAIEPLDSIIEDYVAEVHAPFRRRAQALKDLARGTKALTHEVKS